MDYGTGKRRPFIAPLGSRDGLILASLSPSGITCGPAKPFQRVANIGAVIILVEHWSERLRHRVKDNFANCPTENAAPQRRAL